MIPGLPVSSGPALKFDLIPIAIAMLFVGVVMAALNSVGLRTFNYDSIQLNIFIYVVLVLHWIAGRLVLIYIREKPESPIRRTKEFFQQSFSISVLTRTVPITICLFIFMPAFSSMKASISLFSEYDWDGAFIKADRMIHGTDAWKILHPVIGYPIITSVLNAFYHIWLALIYVITFYIALNVKMEKLRFQYVTSFFLCWSLLGTVFAVAFASVGPCFMLPIQGDATFEPLMDYLREADSQYPVPALDVQNILLTKFNSGDGSLGAGITAMPSMHVSMAMLFFLTARRFSRNLGYLFLAYLFIILIGSVHLGYHYAVDGYFAIIATGLIWKFSGWIADRSERSDAPQPAFA